VAPKQHISYDRLLEYLVELNDASTHRRSRSTSWSALIVRTAWKLWKSSLRCRKGQQSNNAGLAEGAYHRASHRRIAGPMPDPGGLGVGL
jgi:hypothetical protein